MTFWGLFFSDQLIYGAKPSCNQLVAGEQRGVLSAVVPSSGRFIGGDTKFGRVLVGNWANVGWRWGVSSEAITWASHVFRHPPRYRRPENISHNAHYVKRRGYYWNLLRDWLAHLLHRPNPSPECMEARQCL